MTLPAPDPLFLAFQSAVAGRYSLERELGRGGMGVVYLAREVRLDRLVAIKLLPPALAGDPALRGKFLREARVAAKLSHPNIIPIHSVEDTGDFVFFVMAFVDGETLTARVRTRGPLSGSDGTRMLREVAWALAYAHEQGLVHRDVKPDNILIERSTGRVLVADFGIAAATGDALEGVTGTPEFMSPEQALGATIDARSDLYGLGATAFYALSGRFPFEGRTPAEILAKQVTDAPPRLDTLGLTVPRRLASLVDRCLAKDPEHRPASATALAEQLGTALEQRRELPVALRVFVKRTGRIDGGGTFAAGTAILTAATLSSAVFGGQAGVLTFWVTSAVALFGYCVDAARRLLRLGFSHGDLAPAFRAEAEQAREELAAENRAASPRLRKWLPWISVPSLTLFAASTATWSVMASESLLGAVLAGVADGFAEKTFLTMIGSGLVALASTIGWLTIRAKQRDIDTEFWGTLWTGRFGRLAFAIARKLTGSITGPAAMTHRATELSIGMAAAQLFDSLPKETRRAIGDLPALVERLQHDAQALRERLDGLQEALADAGDAAATEDYSPVRATRDAVQDKLTQTVAALETIRLNLLKLHAGTATVHGVTTHLDLAAEISEEVERLIAAHEDLKRELPRVRDDATTPV